MTSHPHAFPSAAILSLLSILLAGSCVSGCAPTKREALIKEVLAVDPAFASVLEKHRELANRIETYERELALKRRTVEQAIAQMRKDLATTAASIRAKTAETKQRLEPERQRLDYTLALASEELRAQQLQCSSLGRAITKLKKALKSVGAVWTAEERAQQEARIVEMQRDAARLDQELAALRSHVRLLKVKLLLLKL